MPGESPVAPVLGIGGKLMVWLLLLAAAVLVLGPFRRAFFRNWRFFIPAIVAGIGVCVLSSQFEGARYPWWAVALFAFTTGLIAGRIAKEWLDDTFGKDN
jgi:hypothetical protein